jgi:hypothetical protein
MKTLLFPTDDINSANEIGDDINHNNDSNWLRN